MVYVILVCSMMFMITANADTWQPSTGPKQVILWPNEPPDQTAKTVNSESFEKAENLVVGKLWVSVKNVTQPTFVVYQPKAVSTGAAVVVFPGGGYQVLSIDLEGTEVCDWLTSKGITCVLLKYRVPDSGCHWDEKCKCHVTPKVFTALQDAQRTISTVRYRAKEYGLDPRKIGVMGFSAGGNLAVLSSTQFMRRAYKPIDDIDKVSCRPDFVVPAYPGHMTMEHKNKTPREIAAKELNTDIVISREIPPTLLIHAKGDPVDPAYYSELYETELKKAGVDVTLKTYETGGHAFGVRKSGHDTDRWTDDVIDWLKKRKIIGPR